MDNTINRFNKSVGTRLRNFRRLIKKKLKEMAFDLKKPVSFIEGIEKGENSPGLLDILTLNQLYGLNPTWVITGKGDIFLAKGPENSESASLQGMSDIKQNAPSVEFRQLEQFQVRMQPLLAVKTKIMVELEILNKKLNSLFKEQETALLVEKKRIETKLKKEQKPKSKTLTVKSMSISYKRKKHWLNGRRTRFKRKTM